MALAISCDVAIVGGGLAGSLIALALAARRPDADVRIIEAADVLGGNHIWSFFGSDVAKADRRLVDPLIAYAWPGYDVAFPAHSRGFEQPYHSITSERLEAVVRATLSGDAILTGRSVSTCEPTAVTLAGGDRIDAKGVIDARGAGDFSMLEIGWQKFVGREIAVPAEHGLKRPIVMDATVEQHNGYRFVYSLPLSPTRVFVEDTYYSDAPMLDAAVLGERIDAYAARRGWVRDGARARVGPPLREEHGALPVAIGGDFDSYWRAGGAGVAKAGMRAGLFHPTTGYSLPDAVRLAVKIAAARDLSGGALHELTYAHAKAAWDARGFYRLLGAMLFRAADPDARYKVLERFYRMPAGLIGRFYAAETTTADKARLLIGKPPVPIGRAIAAIGTLR